MEVRCNGSEVETGVEEAGASFEWAAVGWSRDGEGDMLRVKWR
jgi:hypothetical protein